MADIKIPPVSVNPDESPQGRGCMLDRLTYHRGILEVNGIAHLSDLGMHHHTAEHVPARHLPPGAPDHSRR
jgi:hypothetical protein